MFDGDQTNEYSRRFVAWLLTSRPDWARFTRLDSQAVCGPGAVVVELPNPRPGRPCLQIETDGDWIKVCFDRMHATFHTFAQPDHEAWAEALTFVDDFMTERIALAVAMRGNQLAEWRVIKAEELPPSPAPETWVYVVSWLGSVDQDLMDSNAEPGVPPDCGGIK